jgi:hypothetical protein
VIGGNATVDSPRSDVPAFPGDGDVAGAFAEIERDKVDGGLEKLWTVTSIGQASLFSRKRK